MNKKRPVSRFSKPEALPRGDDWHNGADIEIDLYARSLHRAAKTLIETLDLKPNPRAAWDACPIILLYRQAVELRLKALVGEGSNFLPSPTDSITLYKNVRSSTPDRLQTPILANCRTEDCLKRARVLRMIAAAARWRIQHPATSKATHLQSESRVIVGASVYEGLPVRTRNWRLQ